MVITTRQNSDNNIDRDILYFSIKKPAWAGLLQGLRQLLWKIGYDVHKHL